MDVLVSVRGCGVLRRPALIEPNSVDNVSVNLVITHCLHHREMLEIVMCLEKSVACEELHQYTAYAPDIARKAPAKVEDNLRRPIMSSGNNRRVILVLKCR